VSNSCPLWAFQAVDCAPQVREAAAFHLCKSQRELSVNAGARDLDSLLPRSHEWCQEPLQLDDGLAPIGIDRIVMDTEEVSDFTMSESRQL